MRWTARILAACVVFAAGMGSAQAPVTKLALVIGNADYNGDGRVDASATGIAASEAAGFVPDLRNPLNDATDIREALMRVGFQADLVTNADGGTMSAALAAFGTKVAAAPDDAQVVIYYAGHAIQVDGANFLIPVGARLPAADFARMPTNQVQTILRRVAVSTTEISEQLKQLRAPGANLLIFDACRNNPWEERVRGIGRSASQTRGLAEIAAPPRTVIAFATAPGHTASDGGGRNSPFTSALKTWIGKPGTVLQILDSVGDEVQTTTGGRQTPWFQSASVGQVCLASCATAASAELTASEDVVIGAARTLGGDTLFRLYLQAFPNGRYVGEARTALASAGPAIPVAQRCEQLRVPVNVFFNFDSAVVTPEAMTVLESFARQTAPQLNLLREFCGLSKIVVTGHTDTSMSPTYAVRLSQRQAQSVADALIVQGFPADQIIAEGRGSSEPLVATGPGVREIQNRRVEISLAR
ncbi:MAG: peptidase C14 caspase catalytic subunit p20 [Caulobacteraceae bacterium]|nr:MAG: peptidase C14 caspase catalytic subunit p20 [Caulobacteraceae bacterium]